MSDVVFLVCEKKIFLLIKFFCAVPALAIAWRVNAPSDKLSKSAHCEIKGFKGIKVFKVTMDEFSWRSGGSAANWERGLRAFKVFKVAAHWANKCQ